jgi:hypothetical protein
VTVIATINKANVEIGFARRDRRFSGVIQAAFYRGASRYEQQHNEDRSRKRRLDEPGMID